VRCKPDIAFPLRRGLRQCLVVRQASCRQSAKLVVVGQASNRSRHVERAQHPAPGGTRMDRARVVTVHGRSRGSRLQCDLRVDDTDQQHARMDLRSGRRRCATDANAPRGLLDGLRNQRAGCDLTLHDCVNGSTTPPATLLGGDFFIIQRPCDVTEGLP